MGEAKRRKAAGRYPATDSKQGERVTPIFVFMRRRDIEIETGIILAGRLVVDIPRGREPSQGERAMVGDIIQQLTTEAQAGRLPDDAIVDGWPEGRRPPDAEADEIINNWAGNRISIIVTVDPRSGDEMRLDSDLLRQMGVPRDEPRKQ